MILATLLGVVSSVVAEAVTALNKKLTGTVLQGDAAFLIALGISLVGAVVKEAMTPGFDYHTLLSVQTFYVNAMEVFATAQIYFFVVTKKLGLDVAPTPGTVTTSTSVIRASAEPAPAAGV